MPSAKKTAEKRPRRPTKTSGGAPRAGSKRPAIRRAAPRTAEGAEAPRPQSAKAEKGVRAERAEARGRRVVGTTITIEQYASGIACPVRQKLTLRSLGLRHPRHRVVRPDNPAVRGMVKAIPHLVRIVVEGADGA